jgi:uncharacterized protein
MRKHSWIMCLSVFLFAAAPALAQSPPPDGMAAARELLVTMQVADQFKAIMPSIVQAMKPAIVQNRPQIERDYDAIMPLMLEGMSTRLNEILDQIAALYARTFTADELRELAAFYRGPVGQKFVQKQSVIMQESMVIGQRFGQSVAGEMQNRIIDELRKRGHKI